jgi:hypothetical protein
MKQKQQDILVILGVLLFAIIAPGLAGYFINKPAPKIDIADRKGVLWRTCYPAPSYEYVDAAPICEYYKRINESDEQ